MENWRNGVEEKRTDGLAATGLWMENRIGFTYSR